jgi:hypothetical protein
LDAGPGHWIVPSMLAGVTLHNFIVIGLLASVFIVLLKQLAARSNVRGLQSFAGSI